MRYITWPVNKYVTVVYAVNMKFGTMCDAVELARIALATGAEASFTRDSSVSLICRGDMCSRDE